MKKVKVIYTEVGEIPVIIDTVKESGETYYYGTILGQYNIYIQAKTLAFCLDQLKKAFELDLHFWLRLELNDLGLKYEGKVQRKWYNG